MYISPDTKITKHPLTNNEQSTVKK